MTKTASAFKTVIAVAARWSFHEDFMWVGRVRLEALPPELEKVMPLAPSAPNRP